MLTALPQNPGHVRQLCFALGIGTPAREPTPVPGGLNHRMWRLDTERGAFAVKQLSPYTDLGDTEVVYHYNASEAIAEEFAAHGIPAVFALRRDGEYLQIVEEQGYLVHPWLDARALDLSEISERHALAVARILALMHRAGIELPGLRDHVFDAHPEEHVVALVELAAASGMPQAQALRAELPALLGIVTAALPASRVLEGHRVISHGDLDQKNVLWDARGKPALVDWESARRLNPTYEMMMEALNWSGIGGRLDKSLLRKFVAVYQQTGGVIEREALEASYRCILNDWVYWLMYNVGRAVDRQNAEQRVVGAQQVDFALATLARLRTLGPELLSLAGRGADACV